MSHYTVALIGNPNVGKTTIFNKLTKSHEHTGNWAGKTVEVAKGSFKYNNSTFDIIDLPGIYSLNFKSPEEKIAKDFLLSGKFDAVLIVCDATDMNRSLHLALEVIKICNNSIMCINMEDEAKRKGVCINYDQLSKALNIPVISCSARKRTDVIKSALQNIENLTFNTPYSPQKQDLLNFITYKRDTYKTDKIIDKIVCGKYTRLPVMIIFLAFIIFLTVYFANLPSEYIASFLNLIGKKLSQFLIFLRLPSFLRGILMDGAYKVLSEVISVMFVPMAIFFPLFSLLEESGFLPRIALNSDKPFKKAGSNGKQVLTMCMGLGCNAVGVTGCRIMPTKKQQRISIMLNSFIPCNGRFPTLILLISIMLGKYGNSLTVSLLLTAFIILAFIFTLAYTFLLNKILYGEKLYPVIELPHYKIPPVFKILTESFFDKTLKILGRALIVSAPAGVILWILQNLNIGNAPVWTYIAEFLNPLGNVLSMDGIILLAFILGLPANEIILPIAASLYASNNVSADSNSLSSIFIASGWDFFTALSVSVFTIFHWPCATTLLTIKKETKSLKDTFLSIAIPLISGILLCLIISLFKTALTD